MRFWTRIILIKSGDLFIFNDLSSIIYLTIILQIRSSSCNAQGWQFVQCKFQCDPGCPTILLKFLLNFYCKEKHMLNTGFSLPKLCWNNTLCWSKIVRWLGSWNCQSECSISAYLCYAKISLWHCSMFLGKDIDWL